MNRTALELAHFDGYEGAGTEDLYIVWRRWHQQNMHIAAIPHTPADHVIRNPGKPNYYLIQQVYHETEGEGIGHLRIRTCPFYSFDDGEKFDSANDGKFVPAPEEKEEEVSNCVNKSSKDFKTNKDKDVNTN